MNSSMSNTAVPEVPFTEKIPFPEEVKKSTKAKKRKRVKDVNSPKAAVSGYLHFLNDKREKLRQENPSVNFKDIVRLVANEWNSLSQSEKQVYQESADQDKERYQKDMSEYRQTEAYKIFTQRQEKKNKLEKNKNDDYSVVNECGSVKEADILSGFDVPIFTEEFLDYNKGKESELQKLRKLNTEYEEQNAFLQKHNENMKGAIEKLESEITQQRTANVTLHKRLGSLRTTMTNSFASVPLPGTGDVPSLQTIDSYMARLHTVIVEHPQENESLISTVREIVGRLDFHS